MSADADDLKCSITHDYFRDPVRAEDNHVYERAAITQWINASGTSPLTRQPLNVNCLQTDHEIRVRANQQRLLSAKNHSRSVASPPLVTPRPPHNNYKHIFVNVELVPESLVTNTCCHNIQCRCPDICISTQRCCECINGCRNRMGDCCQSVGDCCQSVGDCCESIADRCQSVGDCCQSVGDCCQSVGDCCQSVGDCCESIADRCQSVGDCCQSVGDCCESIADRCQSVGDCCESICECIFRCCNCTCCECTPDCGNCGCSEADNHPCSIFITIVLIILILVPILVITILFTTRR